MEPRKNVTPVEALALTLGALSIGFCLATVITYANEWSAGYSEDFISANKTAGLTLTVITGTPALILFWGMAIYRYFSKKMPKETTKN